MSRSRPTSKTKGDARSTAPDEREIIELLRKHLGKGAKHDVRVGIGDDAAVLTLRGNTVWSVDTSVEQVHFRREWIDLERIARRSFHAAASDLAAMGAVPVAALSSLILPAGCTRQEIVALAKGQALAARELECPIVGGNVSRGSELSITLNVVGKAKRPLLRSGARAGDELWLVGAVGLARAGLLSWLAPREAKQGSELFRARSFCRSSWANPRAKIAEGLALARTAHAAIDISDGLASDARQLALASGVKVVIDAERLEATLSDELRILARAVGRDALVLALEGGEDYALLASGPAKKRPPFAHPIGEVRKGKGAMLLRRGKEHALPTGFDHFGKTRA